MAAHLSTFIIFTALSGVHSLTTVSKVSVKRGGSISVPCLYESKYRHHVKYLCEGWNWFDCFYLVKSDKPSSSRWFFISDDKQQQIFTAKITDVSIYGPYFWCAVEVKDGKDIGAFFQLSLTKGRPQLSVDHQEVTEFSGEDVTVHCHYTVGGESRWCRLGGSCVKEPSGSIEETKVTINVKVPQVFSVTLSGLRTQSSGWYYCAKGDLQMPVHVKDRPTTTTVPTTSCFTTFKTEHQPVTNTSIFDYEELTTVQAESHRANTVTMRTEKSISVFSYLESFSIRLSVLIFIVFVGVFIWAIFKRQKPTTDSDVEEM